MKILVTGGCGFIGSNFIEYLLENNKNFGVESIMNLDAITYAGRGKNLEYMGLKGDERLIQKRGRIQNQQIVRGIFEEYKPDFVFNFAAESHVDRSIESGKVFVETNVNGAWTLLEITRQNKVQKFVQISTDEVYGSLREKDPPSLEKDILDPRSPYSASKAAAEHFARAMYETYSLPVIITRSSNNYGPYQHPEKFLPKFITNLLQGKKVPLMWSEENQGKNKRDWLHVEDNCRAIWHISQYGQVGEVYNIGGGNERTNLQMTRRLLKHFKVGEERIEKISHRAGHDFRYALNNKKLLGLGFEFGHSLVEEEIIGLCEWYKQNENWWRPLLKNE